MVKKRKGISGKKVLIMTIFLGAFLILWTCVAEREICYVPDYPRVNIVPYLQSNNLTEEEYLLLYQQTGLSKKAIEVLLEDDKIEEILAVQERFFAKREVVCEGMCFLFREELLEQEEAQKMNHVKSIMPALEDGDILISFNTHFLGWRNGHAAIVVDAQNGLTLEAQTLGRDSKIMLVKSWENRPSYAVLRLAGATKEKRMEIAQYAEDNLESLPYRLSAGMVEGLELSGTHCSHLVWYAYQQFGYDLDSDGGCIVTPDDLYHSDLLEIVQVYGMKPE